jgi:hypothetical protein
MSVRRTLNKRQVPSGKKILTLRPVNEISPGKCPIRSHGKRSPSTKKEPTRIIAIPKMMSIRPSCEAMIPYCPCSQPTEGRPDVQ